jgi:hypothetical protein
MKMKEKNWKNVNLTEGQAIFIETLKNAIMNEYNIKVTTNDVLARLVTLGMNTLNKEALIQNPMQVFGAE